MSLAFGRKHRPIHRRNRNGNRIVTTPNPGRGAGDPITKACYQVFSRKKAVLNDARQVREQREMNEASDVSRGCLLLYPVGSRLSARHRLSPHQSLRYDHMRRAPVPSPRPGLRGRLISMPRRDLVFDHPQLLGTTGVKTRLMPRGYLDGVARSGVQMKALAT